jgi:hypothetical protein
MPNSANIKIEAMDVYFGEDTAQVERITCPAATSLNNKYILIGDTHYAWFNVNSGGTDPALAGLTDLEVAVATAATASQVATALSAAIDGDAAFTSTAANERVTLTYVATGYKTRVRDGNTSGFSYEVLTYGDTERNVGYIDGEIELSGFGEDLEPVTAQQRGSTIITHLRKGQPELSATINFKETTPEQLRAILLSSGGVHIPDGVGSTELLGLGIDRQFTSTYAQAKKLRLHPIRKIETDLSEDWTFWKAYPALDTLTFSGEAAFVIPASFMVYPDETKPREIQYLAIGDSSQLGA